MTTESLAQRLSTQIPITDGIANMWAAFREPALLNEIVDALAAPYVEASLTHVVGVEARGFVLGAAVAYRLGLGFVAIRKPGGLYPGDAFERRSAADYRGNEFVLRLQSSALSAKDNVILVDDWFETGSQATAALELIGDSGATYMGSSIVVDQLQDDVRDRLAPVHRIMSINDFFTEA